MSTANIVVLCDMNNSRIQLFDDLDYVWYDFSFVQLTWESELVYIDHEI